MLMYTLQNIHKEAMNILTKNGNEKHYVGIMLHNHRDTTFSIWLIFII